MLPSKIYYLITSKQSSYNPTDTALLLKQYDDFNFKIQISILHLPCESTWPAKQRASSFKSSNAWPFLAFRHHEGMAWACHGMLSRLEWPCQSCHCFRSHVLVLVQLFSPRTISVKILANPTARKYSACLIMAA